MKAPLNSFQSLKNAQSKTVLGYLNRKRKFLDSLGKQLGFKSLDDWYQVDAELLKRNGAAAMLRIMGDSVPKLLQSAYPEHIWLPWKMGQVPKDWLGERLHITSLEDWYRISLSQITRVAPVTPFLSIGFYNMLTNAYPIHSWNTEKLLERKGQIIKASQGFLFRMVKEIFANSEVIEEYFHGSLRFESGRPMQLDIFLPKENLAFEYQGEQHYYDAYNLGPQWLYSERDEEKKLACPRLGITLIEVPYWWDFQKDSLLATIYAIRKDLGILPPKALPIPLEPPEGFKDQKKAVPICNAQSYSKEDPTGWWMSEKYDGVRGYWNGHKLFSKQGKEIPAPSYFLSGFPSIPLDGELWLGRGSYEKLNILIRSSGEDWKAVWFMVFDMPNSNHPFEMRQKVLEMTSFDAPHLKIVQFQQCQGFKHLEEKLDDILASGGEGLMIVEPKSMYQIGATRSLLKVKRFQDTEVRLLEVLPTGLNCEQANGINLVVKCYLDVLNHPPPIGSVLTVKHNGYHLNGTLKHSYFWRERHDISWESIVGSNYRSELLVTNADWIRKKNRRDYFDTVGEKLGVQKLEDWIQISIDDVKNHGGTALLERVYNNSLASALKSIYPEHTWPPDWQMGRISSTFWEKTKNHQIFMEWLGKKLGYTSLDHWYKIQTELIQRHGGSGLLARHENSPLQLLKSIYPEKDWVPWKFVQVSKGFWSDKGNQKTFLNWLAKELLVREMNDWYRISKAQVKRVAPVTAISSFGLDKLLLNAYPNHSWEIDKLQSKSLIKASQRILLEMVKEIFPHSEVDEDFLHADLHFSSGRSVQLDVFVKSEKLAFEYQGEQHYFDIYAIGEPVWRYAERDQEKRLACARNGITLIEVPYWWDFQKGSLLATIHEHRKDLVPPQTVPSIPKEIPKDLRRDANLRFSITIPQVFTMDEDPTGWWMREKLDGIRAYWNGYYLYTKDGNRIATTKGFVENMPNIPLDGDLWMGRGIFSQLLTFLKSPNEGDWKDMKYIVFDLPASKKHFESRREELERLYLPPHVKLAEIHRCEGRTHLEEFSASVLETGGEGVILHEPMSLYIAGPSSSVLEVKDIQVRLLEIFPGGLLCEQPNGNRVMVSCQNQVLLHPPNVGSILAVKHNGFYQNGTLKQPFFWKELTDVDWKKSNPTLIHTANWINPRNRKMFFDELGRKLNLKKLEDWYKITLDDVKNHGGGLLLAKMFSNSLSKALESIYPQHMWYPWKMGKISTGFWDVKANRIKFIYWLFKELKLRQTDDWYRVSFQEISRVTVITPFRTFGIFELVKTAYPNHSWDSERFKDRASIKSSQLILANMVRELFPLSEIHEDYWHPSLLFKSGRPMQFDIFLPKESLAFEYQGQQHYYDAYNLGPQWLYTDRDMEKRSACQANGILLIEIPYWWDRNILSLQATIESVKRQSIQNNG